MDAAAAAAAATAGDGVSPTSARLAAALTERDALRRQVGSARAALTRVGEALRAAVATTPPIPDADPLHDVEAGGAAATAATVREPVMVPFPKIEQFRQTITYVKNAVCSAGEADGEPDAVAERQMRVLPTIDFVGTVKLHGTNAAVCRWGHRGKVWCQSRKSILSATRDNAGFCEHVIACSALYDRVLTNVWSIVCDRYADHPDDVMLCVYGEWCGRGVQKSVGIAQLPRRFVVFDAAVASGPDTVLEWLEPALVQQAVASATAGAISSLHHSWDFPHWHLSIDFCDPGLVQNKLIDHSIEVERECPVAATLGARGVGEGVVWVGRHGPHVLRFKVKGEKHSVSKVSTLASVDVEKLASAAAFVEHTCTENRMMQGFDELFTKAAVEATPSATSSLIRWVTRDIAVEEADTLKKNGLCMRDVASAIGRTVGRWYNEQMLMPP